MGRLIAAVAEALDVCGPTAEAKGWELYSRLRDLRHHSTRIAINDDVKCALFRLIETDLLASAVSFNDVYINENLMDLDISRGQVTRVEM